MFGKTWWWMTNILCVISISSVSAFLFIPNLYGYSKAIAEMIMLCSIFVFCIALSVKIFIISIQRSSKEKPQLLSNVPAVKQEIYKFSILD
jgi:hypothetical protein